jgi:adenine-specific DNA methylase
VNVRTVKRLIEVDLPIRAISAHARREKSIRHGHISTLHIWWARRPLAACRAVLCAALWPDPADETCPQSFRDAASLVLASFAEQVRNDRELAELCSDHWQRWNRTNLASLRPKDPAAWSDMRYALLDFIADFANWDASIVPEFLEAARLMTHAAHLSMTLDDFQVAGDLHDGLGVAVEKLKAQMESLPRPLVVDPFAGGGSIPLEALRVGADAFASDLNPVAVLLNKVVLEYIPKYGNQKIEITDEDGKTVTLNGLAEVVCYWGNRIKEQAEEELAEFYPKDPDGATPIAYLWARTVTCEGPGCGTEVPLIRSLWLAKKGKHSVALQLVPDKKNKRVDFELIEKRAGKWVHRDNPESEIKKPQLDGTVQRGSATCPVCGYTTPVENVRAQLKTRHGGTANARLFCIVTTYPNTQGRFYRLPTEHDLKAVQKATTELERRKMTHTGELSLVPSESLDIRGIRHTWAMIYGLETWNSFFSDRQALALVTLTKLIHNLREISVELATCLALAIDRQANSLASLARWNVAGEKVEGVFSRQAIAMIWDFAEVNPFSGSTGDWAGAIDWIQKVIERETTASYFAGRAEKSSATSQQLPDDSANLLVTDPPYYDAVPYAHLSDFFYVWLKRTLYDVYPDFFSDAGVPKDAEIVVDRPHALSNSTHDIDFYERELSKAFAEGRRVLTPEGIGTIVFASKTTASWEAILQAVVSAGWVITGSWPIDTEMESRIAAQGQARLGSSIHLVCRPRERADGELVSSIGDWRNVLSELPNRIRTWLPRLASEGIVGADAIFACLGPALEIYTRYGRVETASGEQVSLKQYLEVVWAAVAREALGMIFEGADATGFEEDARLTAIWLWTLKTEGNKAISEGTEMDEEDAEANTRTSNIGGYALEYDAARKIAQGLGAHLEKLTPLAHVKGDQARLLSVRERSTYLFGREHANPLKSNRKKSAAQLDLFSSLSENAGSDSGGWDGEIVPNAGSTTLDRLHQSMLLFGVGRGEALKRFLIENGVGKDTRFWRLAQALSALYPSGSDEKRWVDGVLARKKALGF